MGTWDGVGGQAKDRPSPCSRRHHHPLITCQLISSGPFGLHTLRSAHLPSRTLILTTYHGGHFSSAAPQPGDLGLRRSRSEPSLPLINLLGIFQLGYRPQSLSAPLPRLSAGHLLKRIMKNYFGPVWSSLSFESSKLAMATPSNADRQAHPSAA